MNNLDKLGKISETIGMILFYVLIIISAVIVIAFNVSNLETTPETSIVVGSILGNILAIALIYFFWKLLFRPIYMLNKNIKKKVNKHLTSKEYSTKWTISFICSLVFGLLFIIPT